MSQGEQQERKRTYSTFSEDADIKTPSVLAPRHHHPQYQEHDWPEVYQWLANLGPPWEPRGPHPPTTTQQDADPASTLAHLSISPSMTPLSNLNLRLYHAGLTRLQDQISMHHILAHTAADEVTFREVIDTARNLIDGERPTMGDRAANRAITRHAMYGRTGGQQFMMQFLYKQIIDTIGDELDRTGVIMAENDQPFRASSLPRDPMSAATPATPNICYGIGLSQFTNRQQSLIASLPELYLVRPQVVSAYLIVIHSDVPASIIDSDIQAARNAVALLCAQRQTNLLTRCLLDSNNADQFSWVFSFTMTVSHARLNYHFIETGRPEPYYHMHRLRTYKLDSVDDVKTLRRDIWNVLEYGSRYRKQHVVETVELLGGGYEEPEVSNESTWLD